MEVSKEASPKITKTLKWFLSIIGILTLGALGSGVWEKLFSPLLTYLFSLFLNLTNAWFKSYIDDVYYEISLVKCLYSLTLQ